MRQKIPQLDAVLGIAILLVLVHNLHWFYWPPLTLVSKYGWMGVDLFFVLSGFLNRFLMFTGTISYTLYLLHKIPDDVFKRLYWKDAHPLAAFWAIVAISYVLAIVSRSLVEKPFLNLKRFF